MKFPSITSLLEHTSSSLKRFPLAIASSVAGCAVAILLIHLDYKETNEMNRYQNILMTCYLSMLLFIALALFAERKNLGNTQNIVLQGAGIILLVAYYYFLPSQIHDSVIVRFALFCIGLHLLIAFIPFLSEGTMNGFWQYNKILFLRILTSAIYSGVLYIGLSLAILAVDQLFKAHINGKVYGDLWMVIAGIMNTWFFLSGVPKEFSSLDSSTDYPKGLKIFTQYVLLSLITIYLFILYAYVLRIIILGEWPVGWVSYLILGFSIAGILSLLLIWPVRNDEENKWMHVFSRFFYFALFPLIIVLFIAIGMRVKDYGITENRYFVLVLAIWLLAIAAYFLASKNKNIKYIPLSLCVIAFLTSFGPWGAFSVSLRSQKNHFEKLLNENHLLEKGKAVKAKDKIGKKAEIEISSTIEYLIRMHGYPVLQYYFSQNLDTLFSSEAKSSSRYSFSNTSKVLELMNLSYYSYYTQGDNESEHRLSFHSKDDEMIRITDYDFLVNDFSFNNYQETDSLYCSNYEAGNDSIKICCDTKRNKFTIQNASIKTVEMFLNPLLDSLREKATNLDTELSNGEMQLDASNENIQVKILFSRINFTRAKMLNKINRMDARILIKQISPTSSDAEKKNASE